MYRGASVHTYPRSSRKRAFGENFLLSPANFSSRTLSAVSGCNCFSHSISNLQLLSFTALCIPTTVCGREIRQCIFKHGGREAEEERPRHQAFHGHCAHGHGARTQRADAAHRGWTYRHFVLFRPVTFPFHCVEEHLLGRVFPVCSTFVLVPGRDVTLRNSGCLTVGRQRRDLSYRRPLPLFDHHVCFWIVRRLTLEGKKKRSI